MSIITVYILLSGTSPGKGEAMSSAKEFFEEGEGGREPWEKDINLCSQITPGAIRARYCF